MIKENKFEFKENQLWYKGVKFSLLTLLTFTIPFLIKNK